MFRNIPIVTRNLLIINVLAYLAKTVLELDGTDIVNWGGLHFVASSDFHLFQFVTYQFLHGSFAHLFFNMFALWMFGCVIENVWGPRKFLFYYIFCGIGAGICQELVQLITFSASSTIGASGAVYAILLAFGMTFPNERIFIFPLPIPIKAKWFVMIYAAIEFFTAFTSYNDGVAHMAHIGGMLFGFLLIIYWRRHPSNRSFQWKAPSFNWSSPKREKPSASSTYEHHDDMAYNARKKARQEEIDAILDKIRKSGYDSLSKAEKQRLFEASHEN